MASSSLTSGDPGQPETAMQTAVAYIATLVAFTVIDFLWLGVVAKDFYRRELGPLMAEEINLAAGGLFYLMMAAGIVIFAVLPALSSGGVTKAAALGCLLGLLAYATFDLTNLAIIKGFTWRMAVVDMAWGAALTGTTAAIATSIAQRF